MTGMATACGVLLVVVGLLVGSFAKTEVQSLTQITCLMGGLVMFFIAVILARLGAIAARLEALSAAVEAPPGDEAAPPFDDPEAA